MSRIDEIQARVAQSFGREPTSNTTSNTTASRIDQAQQNVLSSFGPRVLDNPTPYATYTTPEPQQVSTPAPAQTNTPTQAEIDWGKQYGFLSDDLLKEMSTPQQPTTPKVPTTEEVNWGKEHGVLSDDLLRIDPGIGGDLAADYYKAGAGHGLAGHSGVGILGHAGIQDRIGNGITDFIGMAFCYGFGCKNIFLHLSRSS